MQKATIKLVGDGRLKAFSKKKLGQFLVESPEGHLPDKIIIFINLYFNLFQLLL